MQLGTRVDIWLFSCILSKQDGVSILQVTTPLWFKTLFVKVKKILKGSELSRTNSHHNKNKKPSSRNWFNNESNIEGIKGSNRRKQEEPHCDKDEPKLTWI